MTSPKSPSGQCGKPTRLQRSPAGSSARRVPPPQGRAFPAPPRSTTAGPLSAAGRTRRGWPGKSSEPCLPSFTRGHARTYHAQHTLSMCILRQATDLRGRRQPRTYFPFPAMERYWSSSMATCHGRRGKSHSPMVWSGRRVPNRHWSRFPAYAGASDFPSPWPGVVDPFHLTMVSATVKPVWPDHPAVFPNSRNSQHITLEGVFQVEAPAAQELGLFRLRHPPDDNL